MREYLDSRTFLNGLEQRLLKVADKFAEKLAKELKSNTERENKELLEEIQELKNGNEHYGKIINSLESEKKKLNDVIMRYEEQNLELMKENQEQEQEIKRLKKLNDTLLNENSYLEDNSQRYKLENRRMKERLKEKGIEWI